MAGVEGIGGARALGGAAQADGGIRLRVGGGPAQGPSFADTLKGALGEVSEMQGKAGDAVAAFVRGDPVEIHDVMAAAEEAGIALDMLIEVRNKLADAYRTVMQMQS